MRRAAQWDGAVPLFESARHGQAPSPERGARSRRLPRPGSAASARSEPFDIVVGGASEPATAADLIGPLRDAGATWWDERQVQTNPDHYRAEPVLRRIDAGPPAAEVAARSAGQRRTSGW